jgi:hypothetical protein
VGPRVQLYRGTHRSGDAGVGVTGSEGKKSEARSAMNGWTHCTSDF